MRLATSRTKKEATAGEVSEASARGNSALALSPFRPRPTTIRLSFYYVSLIIRELSIVRSTAHWAEVQILGLKKDGNPVREKLVDGYDETT